MLTGHASAGPGTRTLALVAVPCRPLPKRVTVDRMFQSLSTALKTLRRSSSQDVNRSVGDDLDLVVMFNEARSDTEWRYVAQVASMRQGRA